MQPTGMAMWLKPCVFDMSAASIQAVTFVRRMAHLDAPPG